jgi:Domain of unknown function (DUF4190)
VNEPDPRLPQYQQVRLQPVYVQSPTRVNGLAIAGMVLGIIWLYWLGSILAVIFGHVSLNQMKKNPNQSGRGFAIAAVALGWTGIGTLCLFLVVMILSAAVGS